MRILILNYEWPPVGGGGGIAARELARQWALEHEVDCVTTHARGLPFREMVDGVTVWRAPVPGSRGPDVAPMASLLAYPAAGLATAMRLLRLRRYDTINTHFAIPSGPLGAVAAAASGVPNILSVHGGDIYDPTKPYSPHRFRPTAAAVRWVLERADAVVAQSTDTAARVTEHYGKHLCPKLNVIPLAFTPPPSEWLAGRRRSIRKELGLDTERFYLVSVGRLVARKGYDLLIDAVSRLPDNARLVLVGSGPLADALRRQVRDAGLEDRVSLAGHVEERRKYRYLAAADCYVLSSHHEGFGIVLQEAMAAGLPIAATREGGQTDLLEDGVNALLMDSNEPGVMACSIRRLMDDEPLRKAMCRANRKKVLRYAAAAVAADYLSVFEQAIRRRHAGTRRADQ